DNDETNLQSGSPTPPPPAQCRQAGAGIHMKVDFSKVQNFGVDRPGNAQAIVNLGDGSTRSGGSFFDLTHDADVYYADPDTTNQDLPGLIVDRGNGWVKIALYGNHPD